MDSANAKERVTLTKKKPAEPDFVVPKDRKHSCPNVLTARAVNQWSSGARKRDSPFVKNEFTPKDLKNMLNATHTQAPPIKK